jgi:hypothetical protein
VVPQRVAVGAVTSPQGTVIRGPCPATELKLKRPVELQRTYAGVNDLLATGYVDVGFCAPAYVAISVTWHAAAGCP